MNKVKIKYRALYYTYQLLIPFRGRYWWFKTNKQYGFMLRLEEGQHTFESSKAILKNTFGSFIPSEPYKTGWIYMAPSTEPKDLLDPIHLIGIKFKMQERWRFKITDVNPKEDRNYPWPKS